jgi:hypothetical protein
MITMARGMLMDLLLSLWSEAISTAVYLKNHMPDKAIKDQTPYKILNGNKPLIRHLKPFGRKYYMRIPEERHPPRSKLLPPAVEKIFMGYTNTNKILRIYISSQKRVVETRQVKFSGHETGEATQPIT